MAVSKTQLVREALLAGEELSAVDLPDRFDLHQSALTDIVNGLVKDGHKFHFRKEGQRRYWHVEGVETSGNSASGSPQAFIEQHADQLPRRERVRQPQPGDTLLVRGLFLGEDDEVEIQATGEDGTYLIKVVAYRAGKR